MAFSQTNIATKGGVVIFSSGASSSPEFAEAKEYASMEAFGMTSTFTFADGSTRQFQPPALRAVIPYPDYAALTLVTEAEWRALDKFSTDAADAARKYPRSATLLQGLIGTIAIARQKQQQGHVVVAGQWLTKADYEKKAEGVKADYVPRLDVAGKTYKNVRLSAVKGEQVKLMHDGGFSDVLMAELKKLPEAERKELARTNPRLAPILGFKASEVGSSAGSIAAAAEGGEPTFGNFSYTINGSQVTITRVGGKDTFEMDRVPETYLKANHDLARAVKEYKAKKGL